MQRVTKSNLLKQVSNVVFRRNFTAGSVCRQSFNVQDQEDFQKRVLASPVPVLIDFHAK